MDKLCILSAYYMRQITIHGIENTFFYVFFMTFFQVLKTAHFKSKHERKNFDKVVCLISMFQISLHLSNDNVLFSRLEKSLIYLTVRSTTCNLIILFVSFKFKKLPLRTRSHVFFFKFTILQLSRID